MTAVRTTAVLGDRLVLAATALLIVAEGAMVSLFRGRVVLFAVLSVVLLEGWLFVFLRRSRAITRARTEEQNRLLICACPFCGRKVGYQAPRAGTGVVCRQCKTAFVLPEAAAG